MLVRVTRAARRCAAIVAGALYALCVVMPSAAIAFGAGDHAAHCFNAEELGLVQTHHTGGGHAHLPEHAMPHVHADGTAHHHDGPHHPGAFGDGHDPAACCGAFGLTAMTVNPQVDLAAPAGRSSILPVSFAKLTGRDPDRITRPPIALPPP